MFNSNLFAQRLASLITLSAYFGVSAAFPAHLFAAAPSAITTDASLDFNGGTKDGGGAAASATGSPGYFVGDGGKLSLSNGVLRNFVAKGGVGSGGGAGFGGALFIGSGGEAVINSMSFIANGAQGGDAFATLNTGGSLNGRTNFGLGYKGVASAGGNGRSYNDYGVFDGGDGGAGDSGLSGASAAQRIGGAGGAGGNGSGGWATDPYAITGLIQAYGGAASVALDIINSVTEAAEKAVSPFTLTLLANEPIAAVKLAIDSVNAAVDLALAYQALITYQMKVADGYVGLGGAGGAGGSAGSSDFGLGGNVGGTGGRGETRLAVLSAATVVRAEQVVPADSVPAADLGAPGVLRGAVT
jgi:hypothetical protein